VSKWAKAVLGEICSVNPRFDRAQRPDAETPFSFVPMAAVDEVGGAIVAPEVRPYRSVAKGYTAFRDGDVLFAKITPCMENGKAAIADNLVGGLGFGSTEFHVLRPGPLLDRNFLFHMVRLPEFRRQAKAQFTGTAGQQRVPTTFLQNFTLSLPGLEEQRNIVDILDRAASIRRLRRQAQATAHQIVPALFHKLFGDPGTNPVGWPLLPLGDVVRAISGATPSKAVPHFWAGEIPWVSAKDLKSDPIVSSADMITPKGRDSGRLHLIPPGTVLVLVRGMTLIHTVPIRLTAVPLTINQDVKALVPRRELGGTWLRWCLQCLHPLLLSLVSSAAHGTRKLDLDRLMSVHIPVVPFDLQNVFERHASILMQLASRRNAAVAIVEIATRTIQARLFG
jgi:type I restriction enzyme, S subunit